MSILTQTEVFPIVLSVMTDGKERSNQDIKDAIRSILSLTPEELGMKTSSGVPVCDSRTAWSISYLHRAGFLHRVRRGVYVITDKGIAFDSEKLKPQEFLSKMNAIIAAENPWNVGADSSRNDVVQPDSAEVSESAISPQESIDAAIRSLNSSLASELLDNIMANTPAFFEKLVVDLLVRMGYGSGSVTQYSNDGGVDGIITTDALGFDPIYTQAKRYAQDNKVGRPEIQAFAGALGHYSRGIFITTSSFAGNAIEYAKTYPHATIVLIDGNKLANLMIQYDLGVSTEREYKIKRIDIDYFDQD